ncbi:hypothetical protein HMPREF9520_03557, partial [Enterococcus faecalis TX1467]
HQTRSARQSRHGWPTIPSRRYVEFGDWSLTTLGIMWRTPFINSKNIMRKAQNVSI